ncbi:MAG: SDR family oxidoreductase [Burkholderiales bacterium]
MPETRAALLVGATGLVGSFLLERLLASPRYARIAVWARRAAAPRDPLRAAERDLPAQVMESGQIRELAQSS